MRLLAAAGLLLALSLSGCMFSKKAAPAAVPVPAVVPPKPPPVTPPELKPMPEPAPTPAPAVTALPAPTTTTTAIPAPAPVKPKPVVRRAKPAKHVQPPVAASIPATVPVPTPAPRLGEMLTPAEQAEMNRTVDQSTALARAALARLRTRRLTAEQADAAERIRTFASQAEQARKTDLRSAAQLARRAEVLARDLEAGLK